MNNAKLIALLTFLGEDTDTNEINIINENEVEIDGEGYKILTEEEADEDFDDYQRSLWDNLGIESFTAEAQEYIVNNFINSEWFDEFMGESYQNYIDDIRNEGNRLKEEMEEAETETEEDFLNYLCEQEENGIEWYKFNFGDKQFSEVVKENNLVDIDKVIEWIRDTDGRGVSLSSYDGVENEQNDLYIYRTN